MFNNELWQKPAGGAGGDFYDYQIAKSVRIPANSSTSSSNGRLTKTFSTVDSSVHWTLNFWIKRAATGGTNPVSTARPLTWFTPRNGTSGSVLNEFKFCSPTAGNTAGDSLMIVQTNSNAIVLSTDNLFRDTSAWYNIHIQADLDNGTNSERLKFFINGTEASYNTDNRGSYTSLSGITAGAWTIGDYYNYGYPIQSYFAQWAYVDGYTHPPTDFGESKNGVWIPKDLSSGITWGSAGHLLDFADSSALGNDVSGNNNDWTTANIDTHDQMLDSPTFGSSSNGGNFATIGGLENNTGGFTFSECNLKYAVGTNNRGFIASQGVPESGKYYWEVRATVYGGAQDQLMIGVCDPELSRGNLTASRGGGQTVGAGNYCFEQYGGRAYLNGSEQSADSIGYVRSVPQTFGFAIDRDNNTFKWTYDGSTYSSTYTIPSSGVLAPFIGSGGGSNTASGVFNFGTDSTFGGLISAGGNADENGYGDFSLAVPSGYLALCAGNLPVETEIDPASTDDNFPQELFFISQYTGNLTNRTITTENQPDLLLIRHYNTGQNWYTLDSTRGITANKYLITNTSDSEATLPQANITSVGATSVGISSGTWLNSTGSNYQMWMWRANGGTTATNGNGGTSSVTQVDPSGAFSIVTYTGFAGASGTSTVGHGLSTAPTMIIHKSRSRASGWWTQVPGLLTNAGYFLNINSTGTETDLNSYGTMNAPTTSVFTINGVDGVGGESANYVAYCFANIEGYCKVGSYVGNGSTDNAFVYTGFRPAFVMIKGIAAGAGWNVHDNAISPFNVADTALQLNTNGAELSNYNIDMVSNGFKVRDADGDLGTNGNTYIYLAFAKNPFKYATAR